MKSKTHQTNEDLVDNLLNQKEKEWIEAYIQNNPNKQGAEVEDIILDRETLEPGTNNQAEEKLRNIEQKRDVSLTNPNGEVLGVTINDSRINKTEDEYKPEIDTDFSPHQSEIATEVVTNPADLIYRTEKWRNVRDHSLPEGLMSVAIGNSPGMVDSEFNGKFNIDEFLKNDLAFSESDRRPKPRYIGFVDADGQNFFAMGAPASTQLNTGLNVNTEEEVNKYFKKLFNGNGTLSVLDVTQGVSTLFDADPIIKNGEIKVESGRDVIYDLFEAKSNAVKRNGEFRWEEELDKALPTNENYGYIRDVTENVESVRDYQELVLDTPAKLGPVTNPEYITSNTELDEETWFVVDHEKESGKTLKQVIEDKELLNVKVIDENGEMIEAQVNYEDMTEEELEEHFDDFFTFQNSMFRPDVAPKSYGVVEVRNFSNSERTNLGIVTQKAMMSNYDGVRQVFENKGVNKDNSESYRHKWVVNGLDGGDLPDNTGMREFYKEDLLPELTKGVEMSFNDSNMPYTLEKTLISENTSSAEELRSYLKEFESLENFLEYQLDIEETVGDNLGNLNIDEHEEKYQVFKEWFVNAYEEEMMEYLDEPSVNQKIQESLEQNGIKEVYGSFDRRAS